MPLTIALVRPPVDTLHKFSKPAEALGVAYLASSLRRDGHEVVIVDAMLFDRSVEDTLRALDDIRPDITGFTVVLNHFPDRLVKLLERMGPSLGGVVLVGGHAVSFFPQRILASVPRVDAVLSGEAEESLRDIAAAVEAGDDWSGTPGVTTRLGGEIVSARPKRIEDLATLPWPARDVTRDVIAGNGVACIATSRGCNARCSFCSVPRFYGLSEPGKNAVGGWRYRAAADVVDEIVDLKSRFDLKELLVVDDEFFGGTEVGFQRSREIARSLIERRTRVSFAISCRAENAREETLAELQEAGLSHVFVGIESGSQQSLKLYGKRHTVAENHRAAMAIKGLGLTFQAGFMLFNPLSTLEDLQLSFAFLREIGELKPTSLNSAVDPHYGAPLLDYFRNHRLLAADDLKLASWIPDERVRAAKLVAEMMVERFQPFMDFIAAVRGSVTFEWRRPVPGRAAGDEQVLDAFEANLNRTLTDVVVRAVERLADGAPVTSVLRTADGELDEVSDDLRFAQALVIAHFNARGRPLHAWRAADAFEPGALTA